jgi:hypothetical protein
VGGRLLDGSGRAVGRLFTHTKQAINDKQAGQQTDKEM